MKRLVLFFLVFSAGWVRSQDWSDTLDLPKKPILAIRDSISGLIGYHRTGKVMINYQFSEGFNFHGRYTSVSKNEMWGIIDRDGKWKVSPSYELISAIVDNKYVAYKDSMFYLFTVSGEMLYSGYAMIKDFAGLKTLLQSGEVPDSELALRVIQIYASPRCDADDRLDPNYAVIVRYLMGSYSGSRWLINQAGV